MKRSEVNVIKHTYEYLPYNNWRNTRLVKNVICNTICYMSTNDPVRNAQLKRFKLITHVEMYPNACHQSYTFEGFGLKLDSMMSRFLMYYRNPSYTCERYKINDHSQKDLQQEPI
jgi:hypothetical protein